MYQWHKGIAQWEVGKTLYLSVPFTWLLDEANQIAEQHKGKVLMGGPAFMKPTYCEGFDPLSHHNPLATFTTRGCVNDCSFCAVPKTEGEFREIENFKPAPLVCDNNMLCASKKHLRKVVDSLKQYEKVDFNQGLQASRFTPEIAGWLGELNCKVRFAFDGWHQEKATYEAVKLCQERTTKDIGVYCLIGYDDSPDEAIAKLETIRSWGVLPNPMRYQPLDTKEKDSYVAPQWTGKELKKMVRYYSRLNWLEHIPYADYQYTEQGTLF